MNLSWSNSVIKYVLFVFNLLLVISGIIMIAVGASVKSYYSDYDIFLSGSYFSLPNLLIATGSLIFFISFFGCYGAIKENWFMIFIFSVLLSLIFILEFSAGIAGYVLRDKTVDYLTTEMQGNMQHYNGEEYKHLTIMWDTIQSEFECCGAKGSSDWATILDTGNKQRQKANEVSTLSTPTTLKPDASSTTISVNSTTSSSTVSPSTSKDGEQTDTSGNLPVSCCKSHNGVVGNTICNSNDNSTATVYAKGCVEAFGDYLKDHAVTIGGVGIAIAVIQLFGVIFACHLTKQLKNGFYST